MEIRADGLGLDPLIALNDDGADGLGIGGACGERYDATTQYSSGEDKAGEAKPSNKPSTKFHPPRALYRPLWAPRPRVPHESRPPDRPYSSLATGTTPFRNQILPKFHPPNPPKRPPP